MVDLANPAADILPGSLQKIIADPAARVCRPRKMMPTDPIQAMEFAQSKGQARKEGKTGVTFGDIAGLEATKEELQEVVEVSDGAHMQLFCVR